jgi:hypothetical protein
VTGSRNKQQCPTAVSRCPGRIEDRNDACFIVKDRSRQALAYVYYEEEPGRRAAANLLTRDEIPEGVGAMGRFFHFGDGRLSRTCKYCASSSGVIGIERPGNGLGGFGGSRHPEPC